MAQSYKTAISFGLVYVPVTLHNTTKNRDIGFNMLHKKTGERIRYKKTCENCPEHIASTDIIRGIQYEKGKYITITDSDIDAIKSPREKTIEITQFSMLGEIDAINFDKSYYVNPTGATKAFRLIMSAMSESNKVGIAKAILGTKEQLVALRVIGDTMILHTMHFHDEIQTSPVKETNEKISSDELQLAKQVIDNMTEKFDHTKFQDEYRAKLEQLIQSKIDGTPIKRERTKQAAKILNLMDALKASVETTKTKKPKAKTA